MQRRWTAAILTAALAATVTAGLAAPAQATPPPYGPDTEYVALGDSYSAGLGASGSVDPTCGQSASGYPVLWAQGHSVTDFTNATCSGAIAGDVIANQLASLSAATDVVTITIGGNDVALGDQVSTCLLWGDISCRQRVDQVKASLPTTLAGVDQAYAAIRAAAPNAQVYVLGYPRLFDTAAICFVPLVPSQASRKILNESVDNLNAALAQRAVAAGFTFVDARTTFDGHGVCSSTPWINGVASLPGPLHPNTRGYSDGYLAALVAVTG